MENNMRHETFAGYIGDLQAVHEAVAAKQESMRAALSAAKKKADSVPANGTPEYHEAQGEFLRAKQKYQDGPASSVRLR